MEHFALRLVGRGELDEMFQPPVVVLIAHEIIHKACGSICVVRRLLGRLNITIEVFLLFTLHVLLGLERLHADDGLAEDDALLDLRTRRIVLVIHLVPVEQQLAIADDPIGGHPFF